ncbi:hypothetical protein CVT24_006870 [Panaeolus cyanescens]|uniref:Chromo domain-containing protein n=1 Tax=Panaeolus cyanescens TaxID=181874 RepID=A0A409W058_9AGAR|nr:hypothetical protein CVT24_006870 [Panaeolus cyanescens]
MGVRAASEESDREASKRKNKGNIPELSDEEGSGDEEEYEIEEVLDAKRGYFPDGRMGYFVKWKGYDESENSWVDERDAENAKDLVDEYWRKNPHKAKAQRDKRDKKSPKRSRKSVQDDASDAGETAQKKRGRKSASAKAPSDDEMDVDEPRAKKAKKGSSTKKREITPDEPEEEERTAGNMDAYRHLPTWEGLVKTVDTVERKDEDLMVYFTLHTGETVIEKSDLCKKYFPQKLLDFYESNLRWRAADAEDA